LTLVAEGWMGYAAGTNPGNGKILYMEAKWKVGADAPASGAFYSPWFGIESADNLNLIQPVNPWDGSSWSIYNEYFQWSPENNINSASHDVNAGDILFGSVTYVAANNSYVIYHSDMTDGWSVSTSIPIQKDSKTGQPKLYTIAYIVYEKVWDCNQYPPDGEVTFYDISIKWDGAAQNTTWTTGIVDDNCNNRASIVDQNTVKISWDTTMSGGKGVIERTVTGLHSHMTANTTMITCDAPAVSCEYLPGTFQCCPPGENCIKNVGCRC